MDTPRDDQLADDLRALRPTPHPEFAAELDKRAAAGFPRRSRLPRLRFESLKLPSTRRLIPAAGVAIVAIAIATVVITRGEEHSSSGGGGMLSYSGGESGAAPESASEAQEAAPEAGSSAAAGAAGPVSEVSRSDDFGGSTRLDNRAVERNAELVLGADPADVADDSADVFEAVHAHDGIVLLLGPGADDVLGVVA